ncbi:hypothetical protein ABW19_dt0203079 [Dactylella cylindrospora]|nr:hypothetical protein ABW19_dt0203079 [Dactylella cylindrospora]
MPAQQNGYAPVPKEDPGDLEAGNSVELVESTAQTESSLAVAAETPGENENEGDAHDAPPPSYEATQPDVVPKDDIVSEAGKDLCTRTFAYQFLTTIVLDFGLYFNFLTMGYMFIIYSGYIVVLLAILSHTPETEKLLMIGMIIFFGCLCCFFSGPIIFWHFRHYQDQSCINQMFMSYNGTGGSQHWNQTATPTEAVTITETVTVTAIPTNF